MFQTDKITALAQVVFQEEGRIQLSGHGMLKRVFLSAYLADNGQEIHPPRAHFYFNRNPHMAIDTSLVRKVSVYYLISEKEAEEQVRKWETNLIRQAKQRGMKFGDFGEFIFDSQLDFTAETLLYFDALPTLPYRTAGVPLHQYPLAGLKPEGSAPMPEKVAKRPVLVPALWTLMIGLFGFAFFLWYQPLDTWLDHQNSLDRKLVNVAPDYYNPDQGIAFYNDTDEVAGSAPDSEKDFHNEQEGSEGDPMREDLEVYETENHLPPDTPIENVNASDSASEPAPPTKAASRCTLIVGAFANPHNVDRMVTRLQGYQLRVVTVERQTLTLVGAELSCENADQIAILKDEIDAGAWLY